MASESILIRMVQFIKGNERMIYSMDKERKYGKMEEGILVNIKIMSSMVMESFFGLMAENTKEIGKHLYFLF